MTEPTYFFLPPFLARWLDGVAAWTRPIIDFYERYDRSMRPWLDEPDGDCRDKA